MKKTISIVWKQKQLWLGVFWIVFGLYIILTKPNDISQVSGRIFVPIGVISIIYYSLKSKNYI